METCLNVKQQKANKAPRVGATAVSPFRRLISHCRLLFAFSTLLGFLA
jgi:hypothetical protein